MSNGTNTKNERTVTDFPALDHLMISVNHLIYEHQREAYKRHLLHLAQYRAADPVASPETRRNAAVTLRAVNTLD